MNTSSDCISNGSILVSIICAAYNEEAYIEDAIKGFLMQKTDFEFEIIINDDCSTDKTAEIIKKYADLFPEKIIAILQKENQHSQGVKISKDILIPKAKGKYIAICEGDDYWIDPLKLQKQVDYMEKNQSCTFCFTNAKVEIEKRIIRTAIPWTPNSIVSNNNCYNVEQLEKLDYIPTASFLFRKKDFLRLPVFRETSFTGDHYWKICLTSFGYAYCINDETCVYRYKRVASTTTNWAYQKKSLVKAAEKFISMYEDINDYLPEKYEIFKNKAIYWEISKYMALNDYKELKKHKYSCYYKKKGLKAYLKYKFMVAFPWIYRLIKQVRMKREYN